MTSNARHSVRSLLCLLGLAVTGAAQAVVTFDTANILGSGGSNPWPRMDMHYGGVDFDPATTGVQPDTLRVCGFRATVTDGGSGRSLAEIVAYFPPPFCPVFAADRHWRRLQYPAVELRRPGGSDFSPTASSQVAVGLAVGRKPDPQRSALPGMRISQPQQPGVGGMSPARSAGAAGGPRCACTP